MNAIPQLKKQITLPAATHWHWILVGGSLLAIAAHFFLRWAGLSPIGALAAADIPLVATIILGGIPLVFQILWKLLRRDLGADLLAVLALVTGAWLGEYLAAVLIILMLAGGRALETYAVRKASSVLLALAERMPSTAHRKRGERIEEITLADIAIGDEIVIFPHETAPVDGVVVNGHGSMDESYLTGEPYQVSKAPGVAVLSGAINGEAALVIRAEKLAIDSRYAQIMEVMQEAEQKRPAMRRLGDQIGAVFAPLALLFAVAVWYFTGDSVRFLAVLVVATPCPLLIAIPITLISAISMAAKRGIIIKDPTVLERLPTCRTAIFDKTGTLTYGKPELTEIIPAAGLSKDDILQHTASLERYSKHPLANAIIQAAEKAKLVLMEAASVSEKPGQGLTGMVAKHEIRVTHRKKLLQATPEISSLLPPTAAGLECIIMMDGKYAATFRFRDAPRSDGKSFIHHLAPSHQFSKVMLVSGDRESEVAYLAELLGIKETMASQNPEQKVAIVRAETAKSPTLFMGDGINDAPALASATVGIAFGQHSSVTAEAAGAVIMENSLVKVDELIHISAAMRHIVLQSAIGGMLFSVIAMGFAAGGFITPVTGALLQQIIDAIAIANALRLTWSRRIEIDLNNY
jgi:heavy metal translocating P-type ATPase